MSRNSRTRAAAVVALALASAACDTGTVPDIPQEFDAQAAIQDYQAMESVLQSDDLSSFHALGARTPFGSAPAAIGAIGDMQSFGTADGGRAYAGRLARRMLSARTETSDGPAAGPIISGWHRGSTFVYDPEVDEYRPDLTLEGAPETGVRFILYEVDEEGTPILDAKVGYADLIDEGDGSVEDIVLRLQVVLNGVTRLEYRITLDHDATSGALTVDGFLVGEEATLDFAVTLAASNVDGVEQGELTFDFGVEERGFSVVGRVSGI
ncbi:MAG: hypothetical protein OEN00_16120, partial [Gemmatimonadota bacterium]|nr:hypothetical protein [Gemmatimonadota bacterium]